MSTCCRLRKEKYVGPARNHNSNTRNDLSYTIGTNSRFISTNKARMSPRIMKRKGATE